MMGFGRGQLSGCYSIPRIAGSRSFPQLRHRSDERCGFLGCSLEVFPDSLNFVSPAACASPCTRAGIVTFFPIPPQATHQRGKVISSLSSLLHRRRTDGTHNEKHMNKSLPTTEESYS